MDIGKAFTFLGEDPKWTTKLLIGGGLIIAGFLALFTVIGWIFVVAIILGYLVQLTRNVIAGQQRPLPEWANWGALMSDGFKVFVVILALVLPVFIIALIFSVPGSLLSTSDNAGTAGLGTLLSIAGGCLNLLLGLFAGLLLPVAIGRYAATNNIGQALNIGAIFAALRTNFMPYLLIVLLSIVTSIIGQLGIIACFIGLPFTLFYGYLVNYHLYGQAYRQTQGALPEYGQSQPPYPPSPSFPY